MQSNIDYTVKTNVIISIGDLFKRFPNLMHKYSNKVFILLQDPQLPVRYQCLMVISHLVLNDMIKLKEEILDVAFLLNDPDSVIREMARIFLQEVHNKNCDIIYNLFPIAISKLSSEFADLPAPQV